MTGDLLSKHAPGILQKKIQTESTRFFQAIKVKTRDIVYREECFDMLVTSRKATMRLDLSRELILTHTGWPLFSTLIFSDFSLTSP